MFRYFTPLYQQIATILREKLMSKPKNDRFFDFVDLKVMYQLVINQITFDINYVIILNMIYARLADFMPYGLLLTSIFELYHIFMPRVLADQIEYCNVEKMVRPQAPLIECKPHQVIPLCIPQIAVKNNLQKIEMDTLKAQINTLKTNMRIMVKTNLGLLVRLD
ncbi:hypothetical protein POM88_018275 [Heracleum sosnowskyi]|uniref:Uncharacterized protein n=1 Tax=Heracleum sosnowskyi TaxID=360622 RepID=A0AAD8IQ83_9APIA|nr:hypothetical protein POM88_018275 [Heracleum sosnowskyi]